MHNLYCTAVLTDSFGLAQRSVPPLLSLVCPRVSLLCMQCPSLHSYCVWTYTVQYSTSGRDRRGEEKRKACMNAHLQQTQPYITNSVQLSSLASLQLFSSVSSNPPSLTAPTISHRLSSPSPPITPQLAGKEIGAALLFCGSLCNQAVSCRRPGAVEKGGGGSGRAQRNSKKLPAICPHYSVTA